MKMGFPDMGRWNAGMPGRRNSIEVTKNPIVFFPSPQKQPKRGGVGKLICSVGRMCDWRMNPWKRR